MTALRDCLISQMTRTKRRRSISDPARPGLRPSRPNPLSDRAPAQRSSFVIPSRERGGIPHLESVVHNSQNRDHNGPRVLFDVPLKDFQLEMRNLLSAFRRYDAPDSCAKDLAYFFCWDHFPALKPLCADGIARNEALEMQSGLWAIIGARLPGTCCTAAMAVASKCTHRIRMVGTDLRCRIAGALIKTMLVFSYKWGGLDTPESFDAGIRAGKAAGDVYTCEKRRLDGDGVSEENNTMSQVTTRVLLDGLLNDVVHRRSAEDYRRRGNRRCDGNENRHVS